MTSESSEKTAIDDLQDVEWMGREIRAVSYTHLTLPTTPYV